MATRSKSKKTDTDKVDAGVKDLSEDVVNDDVDDGVIDDVAENDDDDTVENGTGEGTDDVKEQLDATSPVRRSRRPRNSFVCGICGASPPP
jgi:hypothetical protein